MKIIKRIKMLLFNKKHNTNIHSLKASLDATYATGVMISENVVVSSDVSIGLNSYINRNSSAECCTIGNYCSISSGVWICPYEHHTETGSSHPFISAKLPEIRERVEIGNDVLISLNAVILSGVKIGDGAVVAAGAVVTKDVQPYEIVGGVPAKHIKWRFDDAYQKKLQESKWWLKDKDTIERDVELKELLQKEH